jgi:hypothetical protein
MLGALATLTHRLQAKREGKGRQGVRVGCEIRPFVWVGSGLELRPGEAVPGLGRRVHAGRLGFGLLAAQPGFEFEDCRTLFAGLAPRGQLAAIVGSGQALGRLNGAVRGRYGQLGGGGLLRIARRRTRGRGGL